MGVRAAAENHTRIGNLQRKAGRERHYQLEEEPFAALREWLHPYELFWRDRMKALRKALEES